MPSQYSAIPPLVRAALDRYATEHSPAGGFVMDVLRDDLHGALVRADAESLAEIRNIVVYVYNELPGDCWGSPERVKAWLEKKPRSSNG